MEPTIQLPLFVITGASCAGKSTACNVLFQREKNYIVMESDLLWNQIYNTPEDNYHEYRRVWMRVASNIAQIGKPVVLCGCGEPNQFEHLPERKYFKCIYYLAVVSDSNVFEKRMREGRKVTDENWIKSSLHFNEWLKENASKTNPNITLVNNTKLTPEETAKQIDDWIMEKI